MKKKMLILICIGMLFGCLPAVQNKNSVFAAEDENTIYSEDPAEENSEDSKGSSGIFSYRLIGGALVLVVLIAVNGKNRMKEKQMYL